MVIGTKPVQALFLPFGTACQMQIQASHGQSARTSVLRSPSFYVRTPSFQNVFFQSLWLLLELVVLNDVL